MTRSVATLAIVVGLLLGCAGAAPRDARNAPASER